MKFYVIIILFKKQFKVNLFHQKNNFFNVIYKLFAFELDYSTK